jgi:hypothetical protein
MTSTDIQLILEKRLGARDSVDNRVFTTDKLEVAFNSSMEAYLNRLIDDYEKDEKARRSLSVLTKSAQLSAGSATNNLSANSAMFALPAVDILAVVESQASIRYDETTLPPSEYDDVIDAHPITHDEYIANINNPYKNPSRKVCWRIDYEDEHELITDGTYTIGIYQIRYIDKPTQMNIATNAIIELKDVDVYNIIQSALENYKF